MSINILYILKIKFKNRRIVRSIYEYAFGSKKIWLEKYRYCIKNGHNIYINDSNISRGVYLTNLCYVPLCTPLYHRSDSYHIWPGNKIIRGKLYVLLFCRETYCKYIVPTNMDHRDDFFTNYAFSTVSLIKNCKENGLIIEGEDMYDRKKILKKLMSI